MPRLLHPDQIPVGVDDVRRLLAAQMPELADEPIVEVDSSGTVNAMFRVGEHHVARLPFVAAGAADIEREAVWLPRLAGSLPVRVPAVVAAGRPDDSYPLPWLVLEWIGGRILSPGDQTGVAFALELAAFITALRRIDPEGAPASSRGGALADLDEPVRRCLTEVADLVDVEPLSHSWERSLAAPEWRGRPTWSHGDLLPGNVLAGVGPGVSGTARSGKARSGTGRSGDVGRGTPGGGAALAEWTGAGIAGAHLVGVLDFAAAGVGDPACDHLATWNIVPSSQRELFRTALGDDEDTWQRGRGWALAQAAIALPYYRDTNAGMTRMALFTLRSLTGGA